MMQNELILIVEDEQKIAQILVDFLEMDGFKTKVLNDGENAVEQVKELSPSAVILDLMLPHKDGLTICREVRQFSEVPILMLTARVDEIDRLTGLGIGADDYVCKPFSAREVVARIKVILKRVGKSINTNIVDSRLIYKNIEVDTEKFSCHVAGELVELTPVEFRIISTMIKKPGTVFSRDKIMRSCYEDERIVSSRTIDSHMKNLRAKLISDTGDESLLHSVYGIGYKVE